MINRPANQRSSRHRQRGLTLIEASLAVTVGLVIIASTVVMMGRTNASAQGKNALGMVLTLTAGIQSHFGQGNSYAGISTSSVINAGLVPNSMISGGAIVDPFGGSIAIASTQPTSGTADTAFAVTLPSVPRAECVTLLMSANEGFTRVEVGGVTARDNRSIPVIVPTIATAQTRCSNALNSMRFIAI